MQLARPTICQFNMSVRSKGKEIRCKGCIKITDRGEEDMHVFKNRNT